MRFLRDLFKITEPWLCLEIFRRIDLFLNVEVLESLSWPREILVDLSLAEHGDYVTFSDFMSVGNCLHHIDSR